MVNLDYPDILEPVEVYVQRAVSVLVIKEGHQRGVVRLHRLLEVLAGEVLVTWRCVRSTLKGGIVNNINTSVVNKTVFCQ